jgi:hypothetical protein
MNSDIANEIYEHIYHNIPSNIILNKETHMLKYCISSHFNKNKMTVHL